MSVVPDPRPALARLRLPKDFEPTWDILPRYPAQGEWTEGDYLSFVNKLESHRLIELVNGRMEVLPVPTEAHQSIVLFLVEALRSFGKVLFSGLRVRMRARNIREPDVVFLSKKNESKRGSQFWKGADLVMEVVSEDDPDRDYVDKRREYERAGIPEYWIVDPRNRTVTLLVLRGRVYTVRGTYKDGEHVASVFLRGFEVEVTAVFDAADE